MITEVYPNIFKNEISLPKSPLKGINSYIILTKSRNLIIDTGFNTVECWAELMKGLEELNVDLNITDLFITHMHVDHSGLAPILGKHGVQTIYFSQIDGDLVNQTEKIDSNIKAINHILGLENSDSFSFGQEFGKRQTEFLDFTSLSEGSRLVLGDYCFEVVDIPGHTPGQIGLYEKTHKLFFCGDHILDEITPNITFWGFERDILATYFRSLNKVYKYDIDYLFTGHRKIIRDHQKRISELLEHHKVRLTEILNILREGRKSPAGMAASMHWDLNCNNWEDFPNTQKWFASGEALSHLEHLVHLGLVNRLEEQGVFYYELR